MRRPRWALLCVLVASLLAWSNLSWAAPAGLTPLHTAATATGNGVPVNVADKGGVGLNVTGTFVGTLTWEGSTDGQTTWTAIQCLRLDTLANSTTTTTTGQFLCNTAGLITFRARISAYTSGEITVTGFPTTVSALRLLFEANGGLLVALNHLLGCEHVDENEELGYCRIVGGVVRKTIAMNGVASNTTGLIFTIPSGAKTPIARVAGTGAVTATFKLYGSMENATVVADSFLLCTITLSDTTKDVDECTQFTRDYPFYFATSENVTGVDAIGEFEIFTGIAGSGGAGGGDASAANQTTMITALQLIDDDQTGGTPCAHITTASTNAINCKASAGRAMMLRAVNTTSTLAYLRLYNLSSAPTCSSATGFVESIPIPHGTGAGAGVYESYAPAGQAFSTGIGFCVTGGGSSTDNTNAVAAVYLKVLYK